jgi:WD40 repeat protein
MIKAEKVRSIPLKKLVFSKVTPAPLLRFSIKMNLELLDPWEQEYPQIIEETLEDGYVLNCKFNRRGTLLAAGCLDGRCVVWDFDTKGVSRNLVGHVKPVASIR